MRVVIDTNVMASGIFFKGPPFEILRKFGQNAFNLVISYEILEEYKRVIGDLSAKYDAISGLTVLDTIVLKADLTLSIVLPNQICVDPTDDKFISAAISGKASLIISGDKHLRQVSEFQGIRIINPRTFLTMLE